jgi:hypothetical protein
VRNSSLFSKIEQDSFRSEVQNSYRQRQWNINLILRLHSHKTINLDFKTENENPNLTVIFQSLAEIFRQQRYSNLQTAEILSKYSNSKIKLKIITRLRSQSRFNRSHSALSNSDPKLKLTRNYISNSSK